MRSYDGDHLARIAMPPGGIGTGTVSLGGRGDLRDWEIMNRPAKGFVPSIERGVGPFFALWAKPTDGPPFTRALEGPLDPADYEGDMGARATNHGLPRFSSCTFQVAYPLAQVHLHDSDAPVAVHLEAFNPLIPGDSDASGLPVAVLRYRVTNRTHKRMRASVSATVPNFIGIDGSQTKVHWGGKRAPIGAAENRNRARESRSVRGIAMSSLGVKDDDPAWGTMALATTHTGPLTRRTAWRKAVQWGESLLDFWDDFSDDGRLNLRHREKGDDMPMASLVVEAQLAPGASKAFTFLLAWHFPNRQSWSTREQANNCIGNYYTEQFRNAWDAAEYAAANLKRLESDTVQFVSAFCNSALPPSVKEAALFNLSTLRSQTCFRTPDGRLYGWEGCCDSVGCCQGSCTHVWNYEQALAYLFGDLSRSMRDVEFAHATGEDGCMSFRVGLPLDRAREQKIAAADGQMGCLMKLYRDWQLSADDDMLKALWPKARLALAFCWIPGGWDADQDGVMEGCQHNTMDVEYFGPNPQMGSWYLGALRAAEEMAAYLGDDDFAQTCRSLFQRGRDWMDANLFNGEYYVHEIRAPKRASDIAEPLLIGMGSATPTQPDYQLGPGCLVDQLVGQYMAHICGLGYLFKPAHVRATMSSIWKYNRKTNFSGHFNNMRSYVLGHETALTMAAYPGERPANPFPYFREVMTGFEYTAAVGMIYEGQRTRGLQSIADIRDRYDGRKRNPFDEAECGHHYARALASWGAVLALSGFHYSAVTGRLTVAAADVDTTFFWSTGEAWGTLRQQPRSGAIRATLKVLHGRLNLRELILHNTGSHRQRQTQPLLAGQTVAVAIK
ncbi:MAG: GH116 family glycosyl-hydrolase [Verrucomicrobia bacterium]|nr:GH116 family glycosyl-hydrolase [Verrucomicrobiota bacterium]